MRRPARAIMCGLLALLTGPACVFDQHGDDVLSPPAGTCVVGHVIDGDTIDITGCDDAGRVRLLLIDTPEVHPELECFGNEATHYTEAALLGRRVELERDVRDTDPFGRKLRYIWLDGELFNQRIVGDGYARQVTFPPDVKYEEVVRQAERDARSAGLGLWANSACAPGP